MKAKRPPGDYMRCPGCGRVVLRENAQKIDGTLYGRECAAKIRANYRLTQKRERP